MQTTSRIDTRSASCAVTPGACRHRAGGPASRRSSHCVRAGVFAAVDPVIDVGVGGFLTSRWANRLDRVPVAKGLTAQPVAPVEHRQLGVA